MDERLELLHRLVDCVFGDRVDGRFELPSPIRIADAQISVFAADSGAGKGADGGRTDGVGAMDCDTVWRFFVSSNFHPFVFLSSSLSICVFVSLIKRVRSFVGQMVHETQIEIAMFNDCLTKQRKSGQNLV